MNDLIESISRFPLFANLHRDELRMLTDLGKVREYEEGEKIINEGDMGDSVLLILKGEVGVVKRGCEKGDIPIATLKEGECIGEMAIIDKGTRSATIVARERVKIFSLTNEDLFTFSKVFKNGFTILIINVTRIISKRLREANIRFVQFFEKLEGKN